MGWGGRRRRQLTGAVQYTTDYNHVGAPDSATRFHLEAALRVAHERPRAVLSRVLAPLGYPGDMSTSQRTLPLPIPVRVFDSVVDMTAPAVPAPGCPAPLSPALSRNPRPLRFGPSPVVPLHGRAGRAVNSLACVLRAYPFIADPHVVDRRARAGPVCVV